MKLLKEIFKRPITVTLIVIILIALGIYSACTMSINLLPDISFPYLSIQTVYVGADAETVESEVTSEMESALSSVSGIRSVQTYSIDNASVVLLQFEYGTDLDTKEKDVSDIIDSLDLPSGVTTPTISDIDLNSESIFTMTVYSDSEDIMDVYKKSLEIKKSLENIEGVESAELTGNPTGKVRIDMINGLEPFAALIVSELTTNQSYDIPLGDITSDSGKISLNNSSSIKSLDELKNYTIGVTVSEEYITALKEMQNLISYLSSISSSDIVDLVSSASTLKLLISYLDSMSVSDLNSLYTSIEDVNYLSSLIKNYDESEYQTIYDSKIKPLLEDATFKEKTESQLKDIADEKGLSYSLVKWVFDNDVLQDDGTLKAEGIWKSLSRISTYEKISLDGLESYIDKREKGESISSSDYASIVSKDAVDGISVSSTLVSLVMSDSFDRDMNVLYEYKLSNEHYESIYDETSGSYVDKLVGNDISTEELISLLSETNIAKSIGITPTVRLVDFIKSIDLSSTNLSFKLTDVADVYESYTFESKAYYNSKEAVQIDIYAKSGANATSIGKSAQKAISSFNKENSAYSATMLNNQSDFINDSLSNALVSLLIGMVLAIMVIYLFLRKVKSSLIIAVSMPLSVLATLLCLKLMGITLNMVSVGGIAVGIGMLVDNSIVVLESITTEKQKTESCIEASIKGVKLVLGSLIGSTITSICVFFPILIIDGLTKEIFRDLAWAVIFSLSFSLIIAITVIPTLFCLFYKNGEKVEAEKKKTKVFSKVTNWYSKVLEKVLKYRGRTILISMLIFLASIGLIFTCDIEFLPSIDQGKIEVTIPFSSGDEASYCQDTTMEAYNIIKDGIDNVEYTASSVGWSGLIQTSQSGTISITLNSKAKDTSKVVEDIRELLEEKGFDHDFSVTEIDGVVATLVGGMSGVSVSIQGDDMDTLKEVASKIEEDVLKKNGIKRATDNMISTSTSYKVQFDSEKLAEYGVSYETAVYTLRIGVSGYSVGTIDVDDQDLSMTVGWADNAIDYYGTIEDVIIGVSSTGEFVRVKDCATIVETNGRHIIRKTDSLNIVSVSVESYGIDTNTASKELVASTKSVLKDYDGISYSTSGVANYLSDAFKGLVIALVISFFLLFGVLAGLFESLKKPVIIIFSFPFAFTGGFIALSITQVGLNVVSFIGLIMLMGVVINNAIVLNERIDQLIESGVEPHKAVIEGCRQRLRAVLMTTLTTILALIPMALGIGKGSELMQPLGVVAIGGMTVGTCVTLILIPAVYSVFYKIKYRKEVKVYTGEDYLEKETEYEKKNQ